MVYAVKLNPLDETKPPNEPMWLSKYEDVVLEDITQLPQPRDVDHATELILGHNQLQKDPTRCLYQRP